MMRTIGKTVPSVADNMQKRISQVIDELRRRKGTPNTPNYIDTYEFGFIKACEMFNEAYHLNIDFGEEE